MYCLFILEIRKLKTQKRNLSQDTETLQLNKTIGQLKTCLRKSENQVCMGGWNVGCSLIAVVLPCLHKENMFS